MAGGRPRHYDDPDVLQKTVDEYFEFIKGLKTQKVDPSGNITETWERSPEPATITGLTLFLGFNDRQSLYDYEKNEQFSGIVKNARTRVECEYEKKLTTMQAPAGSIFALKNMGWKDKHETELTGKDGSPLVVPVVQLPDGTNLEI